MNSQRTTIVLDCDGVLANLQNPLETFIAEHYNRPLSYKDPSAYLLRDSLGISKEEEYRLVDTFYRSPFFVTMQPYEDAVQMVHQLSQSYNLAVATARPAWLREQTRSWHALHFSPTHLPVYHTGEYYSEGADFPSKAEICRHLNAPLIIEDRPSNALACAEQGIAVILINHCYNQEAKHEHIAPVTSRLEVPQKVKQVLG